jgi:hypothetical protein
MNSAPCP